MNRSLLEIAEVLNGQVVTDKSGVVVNGVVTDSRKSTPGTLFFALSGENFDGHDFVGQAFKAGSVAAVVSRPIEGGPYIKVRDTLVALQKLAAYHRDQYEIPVIAVTGSVGKTTTKDLLAHCLDGSFLTLKTPGNYNNEIGLPLTLLSLSDEHQACVIELAMRSSGEISLLSQLARPTGCIIVNIAPVHLETMDTIENIARAKCEVLLYTRDFAVINGDLSELDEARFPKGLIYRFGYGADCDWRILNAIYQKPITQFEIQFMGQQVKVGLPFPATHLVESVAAAVGTAILLGIDPHDIKERLMRFQPSTGRLNFKQGIKGTTVIDDSYNANPKSMTAALKVLKDWAGTRRKIAVLGDMFELGSYEIEGHRLVGEAAARMGLDILLTIGNRTIHIMEGARSAGFSGIMMHFENKSEAIEFLTSEVVADDVILVKASRGMHMEKIVKALLNKDEPDAFKEDIT